MLAADLSFNSLDYNRSFYFYNQARLCSLCLENYQDAIQCLKNMSKIGLVFKNQTSNIPLKLLRKALAISFKIKNQSNQMQIYDLMGNFYSEKNDIQLASYYHQRYSKNIIQDQQSVIKRIYLNNIAQDLKNMKAHIYRKQVDLLLIQTLNLPLMKTDKLKQYKIGNIQEKNWLHGRTPRVFMIQRQCQVDQPILKQIKKLMQQKQFLKQLPQPNQQPINRNLKIKLTKRIMSVNQFNSKAQFQRLIKIKNSKSDKNVKIKQLPLQRLVRFSMPSKSSQSYQYIKPKKQKNSRNNYNIQTQSLLSIPDKKSHSHRIQKFKTGVNKAILNWIDS